MKAVFNIEYFTDASLCICFDDGVRVDMQPLASGGWRGEREIADAGLRYRYCVCRGGQTVREEPRAVHDLTMCSGLQRVEVYDRWYEPSADAPFCSSLFTDAVFRRQEQSGKVAAADGHILLEVEAPTLRGDECLYVTGSSEALGCWDTSSAVAMSGADAPLWRVSLPIAAAGAEYKFVVRDCASGELRCWEDGCNCRLPAAETEAAVVVAGLRLRDGRLRWRGAGVAVPLFSLRSECDWGVGEFRDIAALAEWSAAAGLSVIQLLPVNDTSVTGTWRDSYPYNPLSCFALHPLYLCATDAVGQCRALCTPQQAGALERLLADCLHRGAELNALSEVDYEAVMELKSGFLRRMYDICGEEVIASDACRRFIGANGYWLRPYAVFCALRDQYGDDRSKWGPLGYYDAAAAEKYAADRRREVDYYCFVQYILDGQMHAAREAAHACGIALKGDIPIGVAPTGVDVWQSPELFNVAMSAGAPPDAFSAEGQNWGFPTYDWERMAADGYDWWRRRLCKMGEYFDAYRLDHVLGFFRIWEIPRTAVSRPCSGISIRSCPCGGARSRGTGSGSTSRAMWPATLHRAMCCSLPPRGVTMPGSRVSAVARQRRLPLWTRPTPRPTAACMTTSTIAVTTLSGATMPCASCRRWLRRRGCLHAARTWE